MFDYFDDDDDDGDDDDGDGDDDAVADADADADHDVDAFFQPSDNNMTTMSKGRDPQEVKRGGASCPEARASR